MAPEEHPDPSPAVGRLSAEFVLTFLKGLSGVSREDFIDGVIRIAILDANVRHLMSDPEVSRRYATFELPVPDELRRPVSINAIAASLGLPFETVRRRIHDMSLRDLCVETRAGVLMTKDQLTRQDVQAFAAQTYADLADFHHALRRFAPGFPLVVGDPPDVAPLAEAPTRLAMRSASGYVLRYVESAREVAGDLISAILFLAVVVANVEHITRSPEASDRYAEPRTAVPDDQRRRVTVKGLSREIGLSFETTRRRMNALIEAGVCARDAGGIYVPAQVLLSPPVVKHRRANAASLQRLFTGLRRQGVSFD